MRHAVAHGELQRRAQERWCGVRQWSLETRHLQKFGVGLHVRPELCNESP